MKNQTHILTSEKYNKSEANYKKMGRVYTPKYLAVFLAKAIKKYSHNMVHVVMDPACGMGELLLATLKVFGSNLSTIIGNDISKEVVNNFSDYYENQKIPQRLYLSSTDALTPFGMNTSNSWIEYFKKNNIPQPDIVIANPPWGADISIPIKNRKNYTLLLNQFDSSDLFVESITNNISEGGILGIIIPDSLFFLQREPLRKYFLCNYKLRAIIRIGEKLFPKINRGAVIIVCEKKSKTIENQENVDCFTVPADIKKQIINGEIDLFDYFEKHCIHIPQTRFSLNQRCQFDIQVKASENIIPKINKIGVHNLEYYLEGNRGVELSKNGKVIRCPFCSLYLPLPRNSEAKCSHCGNTIPEYDVVNSQRLIIDEKKKNFSKPIIVGENIHRYSIKQNKFIDTSYDGINYKTASFFSPPKILIRKTGIGVSAAIDYSDSLCNQVVYSYRVKDSCAFPLELFIAILNSRLAFYYFTGNSGETTWRSHPYLTQKEINGFPIPKLDQIEEKELYMLVAKVQEMQKEKNKQCDIWIESFIAKIYGMAFPDYRIIFDHINSSEHLQVVKELLEIDANEVFYGV